LARLTVPGLGRRGGVKLRKGVTTMKKNKKICFGMTKQIFISVVLALVIAGVAIPPGLSRAGDRIKPEMVLPKAYPDGFNAYGHINTIDDKIVVIDDEPFTLSPDVTYNIPTRLNASKAYFKGGVLVGVLTNAKGEAKSLWLLE
jgi:hypothetical protein